MGETWVVHWNIHLEDGATRDRDYTTLVSAERRTRISWDPRPQAEAVEYFETPHRLTAKNDCMPTGWSLEPVKDLGIAAPMTVTR